MEVKNVDSAVCLVAVVDTMQVVERSRQLFTCDLDASYY
jgi:hypothetical protein